MNARREPRVPPRRCTVPGCSTRRNLRDHPIRFRSAGGSDAPDDRITLCAFHHQRGVHGRGGLRVWGRAPRGVVFELPFARCAWGDVRIG